jgi:hypothetical protein
MFVSVVIGLFVGLMNYIGLRKLLSFNKSQGLFYQIKRMNCSHVIQFLIQNFKDCYFHQEPDLQGMVNIYVVHNVLNLTLTFAKNIM